MEAWAVRSRESASFFSLHSLLLRNPTVPPHTSTHTSTQQDPQISSRWAFRTVQVFNNAERDHSGEVACAMAARDDDERADSDLGRELATRDAEDPLREHVEHAGSELREDVA
eukprot:1666070-Rhodomonas_salina.1